MATAELIGAKELVKQLDGVLPRHVRAGIRRGMRKSLNYIKGIVQATAPRGAGEVKEGRPKRLADAIKVRAAKRSRGQVSVLLVVGGDEYPHGGPQEFGWFAGPRATRVRKRFRDEVHVNQRHIPGKAFARGPFYENKDVIEGAIADELRKVVSGNQKQQTFDFED